MNTELTNVSILFRFFLIMCYTKASFVVFNLYTHEGLLEECNLWTNNKHIKKNGERHNSDYNSQLFI